jgi:hypothetical protein
MKGVPSKPPLETVAGQHHFQSMPLAIYCLYSYPLMLLENRGRKLLMILISIFSLVTVEQSTDSMHGRQLSIACRITRLPEDHYPYLRKKMDQRATYYSRDLPYSFDFLLENFMDPAHIPFAHHSLQGKYSYCIIRLTVIQTILPNLLLCCIWHRRYSR